MAWDQIRPHGNPPTRAGGFEELTSILIEQGAVSWPEGVRFERFGSPDGGREGRGILPSGEVWAWQAKYLDQFNDSAAGQVTQSVRRVVKQEPTLARYFVAMPFDLPAGDGPTRTSAATKWSTKSGEWAAIAKTNGLTVDFIFIGAHELFSSLTEARHSGRLRYWFGAETLTPDWQAKRLEEVVAKVDKRYSPRLHVEVAASAGLEGVGRTTAYVGRWQSVLADLRESRNWRWPAPQGKQGEFAGALDDGARALDAADAALDALIRTARTPDELPSPAEELGVAAQALDVLDSLLHEHTFKDGGYFTGDAASLYGVVRRASAAIHHGIGLARSSSTAAARAKGALVIGRAGAGKTHLMCDVATRRLAKGRPTLLLLGQDFDGRNFLSQFAELAQLGGTVDDALAVLDAAGEAAGAVALLMVDALNDSERPERWRDDLRALLVNAARWPHVAIAVSCRSEFLHEVVGDTSLPTMEHVGFGEATDAAIRRFAQEYELEAPTFPVLSPEFGNPLLLKLTCDSLRTLGLTRFPFGAAGLARIYEVFLQAVNQRLSAPNRCNYDPRTNLVNHAVSRIAALGAEPFARSDVSKISEEVLPNRGYLQSLLRGLISEGVISESPDERIAFAYQRLGDVARAELIAGTTVDEPRQWLMSLGQGRWRERGVLGALGVILPERHGVELLDLVAPGAQPEYDLVDSFLESLLLRDAKAITPRAVEFVNALLTNPETRHEIFDRLVRLACIPGHPLNAGWLHARLMGQTVAERDQSWSLWLIGMAQTDEESPIPALLEWAWPRDLGRFTPVADDVAELATLLFGWCLSTSDRRVRDQATKALVALGQRAPAGFASGMKKFRGCNDPYVTERLMAAACGATLRSADAGAIATIAAAVGELVVDAWPVHLMARDYAQRVLDAAREQGNSGSDRPHRGTVEWPIPTRSFEEIESLAAPPEYAYASIWRSISWMGDFGRYIVESALRHVVSDDPRGLQHLAERAIFDRALDLGWTPERFRGIDRGSRDRSPAMVERIGKKYQWIGLYEVLGRVADTHQIKADWGNDPPGPYERPEQLIWRDIDPTLLARKPELPAVARPWFSPAGARFPLELADAYPSDVTPLPDPLDLIPVTDPAGQQWLVLTTNPDWRQELPPEVEALRVPYLQTWMQIHAYLIPTEAVTVMRTWAVGKDWFGRWMPDTPDVYNVLLGAHPRDPRWRAAEGTVDWREVRAHGPKPTELTECAAFYGGTGTSRDGSAEDETSGFVPSDRLFQLLGLEPGVDFAWRDAAGVAACDPSVSTGGPAALIIRRDTVRQLARAGLTLFWTVLSNCDLVRPVDSGPDDEMRWVSASASYVLDSGRLELVDANASVCRPGPTVDAALSWSPRPAE